MSTRRSLLICTAAAGLVMSAALTAPAAATPAAETPWRNCEVGEFCVYEHDNGYGGAAYFRSGTNNLGDYRLNDKVSSVWNRTGKTVCTYVDTNKQGSTWPVGNWKGNTSQYNRNDNISSLWVTAC
ncbi:peptidase inhibitor family I36 protein [Streptomyces sp. TBY4]|uniref:peptidase inhibitor family I36 protein n=1 Tax=Streptomyces sp. TBY4 TaxID=2962030 RepID=UPI0020B8C08D|nr:peptidase inhibitor family I36 protein [Streptomyces sp. TBY4]MCP3759625.1 peptidase inhibitor family I36 protein [Streptomyces sp. TBY4]